MKKEYAYLAKIKISFDEKEINVNTYIIGNKTIKEIFQELTNNGVEEKEAFLVAKQTYMNIAYRPNQNKHREFKILRQYNGIVDIEQETIEYEPEPYTRPIKKVLRSVNGWEPQKALDEIKANLNDNKLNEAIERLQLLIKEAK